MPDLTLVDQQQEKVIFIFNALCDQPCPACRFRYGFIPEQTAESSDKYFSATGDAVKETMRITELVEGYILELGNEWMFYCSWQRRKLLSSQVVSEGVFTGKLR